MSFRRSNPSRLRKNLTRGLFTALCLSSLLICIFVVHLRLRLSRSPHWCDLLYTSSAGGRCWMIKSFNSTVTLASDPVPDASLLILIVEHPWPNDQPLMWSRGDNPLRPTGPTRAGKVTILQRTDFHVARYMRWEGFAVGHWKDGALLYDTPGRKADHFSDPMLGWSISMPYWVAILLTALLPGWWVVKQIQWAQQPRGRLCPECACDIPPNADRCPDCHLLLGPPTLGTSANAS